MFFIGSPKSSRRIISPLGTCTWVHTHAYTHTHLKTCKFPLLPHPFKKMHSGLSLQKEYITAIFFPDCLLGSKSQSSKWGQWGNLSTKWNVLFSQKLYTNYTKVHVLKKKHPLIRSVFLLMTFPETLSPRKPFWVTCIIFIKARNIYLSHSKEDSQIWYLTIRIIDCLSPKDQMVSMLSE